MLTRQKWIQIGLVTILPMVLILSASMDVGPLKSTPDGWTRASWRAYVDKNKGRDEDKVKAIKFIQSSSKRRQERDIYLMAIIPESQMIDGHVAAVEIKQNKMSGESISWPIFECECFAMEIGADLRRGSNKSFSESLVAKLNRRIEESEHSIAGDTAFINETDDENGERMASSAILKAKGSIDRFRQAIINIREIGD